MKNELSKQEKIERLKAIIEVMYNNLDNPFAKYYYVCRIYSDLYLNGINDTYNKTMLKQIPEFMYIKNKDESEMSHHWNTAWLSPNNEIIGNHERKFYKIYCLQLLIEVIKNPIY